MCAMEIDELCTEFKDKFELSQESLGTKEISTQTCDSYSLYTPKFSFQESDSTEYLVHDVPSSASLNLHDNNVDNLTDSKEFYFQRTMYRMSRDERCKVIDRFDATATDNKSLELSTGKDGKSLERETLYRSIEYFAEAESPTKFPKPEESSNSLKSYLGVPKKRYKRIMRICSRRNAHCLSRRNAMKLKADTINLSKKSLPTIAEEIESINNAQKQKIPTIQDMSLPYNATSDFSSFSSKLHKNHKTNLKIDLYREKGCSLSGSELRRAMKSKDKICDHHLSIKNRSLQLLIDHLVKTGKDRMAKQDLEETYKLFNKFHL